MHTVGVITPNAYILSQKGLRSCEPFWHWTKHYFYCFLLITAYGSSCQLCPFGTGNSSPRPFIWYMIFIFTQHGSKSSICALWEWSPQKAYELWMYKENWILSYWVMGPVYSYKCFSVVYKPKSSHTGELFKSIHLFSESFFYNVSLWEHFWAAWHHLTDPGVVISHFGHYVKLASKPSTLPGGAPF